MTGRRGALCEPQDRIRFILEKTDYVQRLKADALMRKRRGKKHLGAQESPGRVDVLIAAQANTSPTTVKQVRKVLESKIDSIIAELFHPDPRRRIAIAEAAKRVTEADEPRDEDTCTCDVYAAAEKIERMDDEEVEHLIDLVNAHYRIAVYEVLSEIVSGERCICDECRSRTPPACRAS